MLIAAIEFRDSLAYFLANTFAIAACWVVSAVIGAAVIGPAGGKAVESFTGSLAAGRKLERSIALLGSGLLGLNGALIIAAIEEYAGILSMVYLWAFVLMATSAFFGRPGPRPTSLGLNDDLETALLLQHAEATQAAQIDETLSRSTPINLSLAGALAGGLVGLLYGLLTSWLIPLTTDDSIFTGSSASWRILWVAVSLWAVLCGFGGSMAVAHAGLARGLANLLFGLVLGTGCGGLIAILGLVLGDQVSAAVNGAAGAMFFAAIIFAEIRHAYA